MNGRDDVRDMRDKAIDSRNRRQAIPSWFPPLNNAAKPAANGHFATPVSSPKLWNASDLKAVRQAKFLAKQRIPYGAVTNLCGDEGIGKSLFWVWIVAAVTTGKPLPEFGIPQRDPADVILVLTEDDWATEVLPRLTVAQADTSRVRVICADDDGTGSPVFPADIGLIVDADPVPALVVVDAWIDTVSTKLMVRDTQQSRAALNPWRDAAGKTGAAIILITHTNRLTTGNIRDKYGLTATLRQKARMTLFALADPQDGSLIIGPDKSNSAPGGVKASRFNVVGEQFFVPTDDHDGTVPTLEYVGCTGRTVKQHLAEMADEEQRKSRRRLAAEEWLIEFLANGPRPSTEVYAQGAATEGEFSRDQLKRARSKVCRPAFHKDGDERWWCELLPEYDISATALAARSANKKDGEP